MQSKSSFNRRDFLKVSGAGAAADINGVKGENIVALFRRGASDDSTSRFMAALSRACEGGFLECPQFFSPTASSPVLVSPMPETSSGCRGEGEHAPYGLCD